MRIRKAYWLWGQFSSKETYYLDLIRNKVYTKLNGPKFESHITLGGPFLSLENSFFDSFKNFANKNEPIKIHLKEYSLEEEFFKSIYIAVEYSLQLQNLRRSINRIKKFDLNLNYDPHISLIYGKFKKSVKKDLIYNLPALKHNLSINKLSLVEVNEDIFLWRILDSFRFKIK